MTFPDLEKIMEFPDFSRFSMTGYKEQVFLRFQVRTDETEHSLLVFREYKVQEKPCLDVRSPYVSIIVEYGPSSF